MKAVRGRPPGRHSEEGTATDATVATIDATLARLAGILASPRATIAELRERNPDLPDSGRTVEAAYIDLREHVRAEIDEALDARIALAA